MRRTSGAAVGGEVGDRPPEDRADALDGDEYPDECRGLVQAVTCDGIDNGLVEAQDRERARTGDDHVAKLGGPHHMLDARSDFLPPALCHRMGGGLGYPQCQQGDHRHGEGDSVDRTG